MRLANQGQWRVDSCPDLVLRQCVANSNDQLDRSERLFLLYSKIRYIIKFGSLNPYSRVVSGSVCA